MTEFVIVNDVNTTLAASITSSQTTFSLSSSANLPTLTAGQVMPLTLRDAATRLNDEIVWVTSISGSSVTCTRAQEGTGAQSWAAGDYAYSCATAAVENSQVQQSQLDSQLSSRSVGYNGIIALVSATDTYQYVNTTSFAADGSVGGCYFVQTNTGQTPTTATTAAIITALATGKVVNAAGVEYTIVIDKPLNPWKFGAVGGGADDYNALQSMVSCAVALRCEIDWMQDTSGTGLFKTTHSISVTGSLDIKGRGKFYSGIRCAGCNGFEIAAGVNFPNIRSMAIVQEVRYTTTPNSYIAINSNATSSSKSNWGTYKDLFVDGFYAVAQAAWCYTWNFAEIISLYCHHGILSDGSAVNNFVQRCHLGGDNTTNSIGISVGDGVNATEGWIISDNLLYGFGIGVQGNYASNCQAINNIIDYFNQYAVYLVSSANGGSTNWDIDDNYMAATGTASAGVRLSNSYAPAAAQYRGNNVRGNQILVYSGSTLARGIYQEGTEETLNDISENRIDASTYAIYISNGDAHVHGNRAKNGTFYFASSSLIDITGGNNGTYASSIAVCFERIGKYKRYFNSTGTTPTGATPAEGDEMKNISAMGTGVTPGWVYSASDSSWHALAVLS